jgi:hypothetical protein
MSMVRQDQLFDKGSRYVCDNSFSMDKSDFSKTEVVKGYVYTILGPVIDYWKETIEDKKGDQMT